jgi:hypothetical protein
MTSCNVMAPVCRSSTSSMIVVMGRELGQDCSLKDSSMGRGEEMTRADMIAKACPGFAPSAVVDQLPVVRSRMVVLPYRQCSVV